MPGSHARLVRGRVKPSNWLLFASQQSITRLPLWIFGSQLIDAPLRVLNHRLPGTIATQAIVTTKAGVSTSRLPSGIAVFICLWRVEGGSSEGGVVEPPSPLEEVKNYNKTDEPAVPCLWSNYNSHL